MTRYRSYSIDFKRQIAQEFLAGETLHGLEKRHDISRNLIRVWVESYQAGPLTRTPRRQTSFSNTKLGSPRLSGWSASRHWSWSF
jgi:transposase-like protein